LTLQGDSPVNFFLNFAACVVSEWAHSPLRKVRFFKAAREWWLIG